MKWLIPFLIMTAISIPMGSAQQTVDIIVSFDTDSFNSTKMLVSDNLDGLTFSIGNVEVSAVNGVVDFGTNVFNLGDTMKVIFGEEIVVSWTIPGSQFVHVQHVYSRWVGGQPPPIDNIGLGQGAVLTLNRLVETSESNKSKMGELVVNTMLGGSADLNDDGEIQEALDPFGLLQFLFGMRDHLSLAGTTPDVHPQFAKNVSAVLPLFDQLMDKPTYAEFLQVLNTSQTLMAKTYQTAFALANGSGNQTFNDLKNLLEDSFNLVHSIFLQPRANTFGGIVTVHEGHSTDTKTGENGASLQFFAFILPLLFLRKKFNR